MPLKDDGGEEIVSQTEQDRLSILRLAYEQGLRGLDGQDSTLGSIRQSGAAIAALNGLTAASLGRYALDDQRVTFGIRVLSLGILEWGALLALVASIVCVVQLFRPRSGWVFHFEPSRIIDQFAHGALATTLARTLEELARFSEMNFNSNERMLRHLFVWLVAAVVSFCFHVCFWLVAIA